MRQPSDQRLLHHNSHSASDFTTSELVEESREIDLPTGKGYRAHWYFDSIWLGYARWRYQQPFTAEWRTDLKVVHLHVNLRSRPVIENRPAGLMVKLSSGQHNMLYAKGFVGLAHNEGLATAWPMPKPNCWPAKK